MRYFPISRYNRQQTALQKQVDEIVASYKGTDAAVRIALFDAIGEIWGACPYGFISDRITLNEIAASQKRLGIRNPPEKQR